MVKMHWRKKLAITVFAIAGAIVLFLLIAPEWMNIEKAAKSRLEIYHLRRTDFSAVKTIVLQGNIEPGKICYNQTDDAFINCAHIMEELFRTLDYKYRAHDYRYPSVLGRRSITFNFGEQDFCIYFNDSKSDWYTAISRGCVVRVKSDCLWPLVDNLLSQAA